MNPSVVWSSMRRVSRSSPNAKLRGRFDPSQYEQVTFRNEGGAAVSKIEVSAILRLLSLSRSPLVLEVGMGTGRILGSIIDRANAVVGLDPDPDMVHHFANSLKHSDRDAQKIDLVVATGESLPFRRNSFTAVICVRALRYFVDADQGVREMCSVLEHKGRLVLEFSNIFQPRAVILIPQLMLNQTVFPRLFRLAYMRRQVSANGVSIDTVLSWHKFPPGILTRLRNHFLVGAIRRIEVILQRTTPVEFLSRSIVISGLKDTHVEELTLRMK